MYSSRVRQNYLRLYHGSVAEQREFLSDSLRNYARSKIVIYLCKQPFWALLH